MKLGGRVPVEPLDDERMTNIERRIVAGAADAAARPTGVRAPRWLGFAAAAMAAVAAGALGWKLRGGGASDAPVAAEAPLQVATQANQSTLSIGDASITSDPQTAFVVTRPEGGVLVDLARGKVELEVNKRGNRPPLVVRAGDTDVIVVGTHFSVDYGDGTGEVEVRVTEGVVKVVRHREEARVAANQAWETKRGVIALANARVTPPAGADATNDGGDARGPTVAAGDRGATVGSNGFEIDMGKDPDLLHGRTAQVPDGRTPPANRTGTAGSNSAAKPEVTTPSDRSATATKPGVIDIKAVIESQPMDPPMAVDETPDRSAASLYSEIMRSQEKKGEEESRAYYGLAYTQAYRLGRTDEALKTIDAYKRRFTQGRVYPERLSIAWLELRITCKRGLGANCRQAAEAYLKLAPGDDNPKRHAAELLTLRL